MNTQTEPAPLDDEDRTLPIEAETNNELGAADPLGVYHRSDEEAK